MTETKRVPSMGKDDRNFRSHYYEKVGFRGVDERKALELLWQDDPLNLEKFSNFALKHSLPFCDRLSVWKVILSVAPRFAKNKEKHWKWKVNPYEDSLRFMKSSNRIQETMQKSDIQAILWLLFKGELKIDFSSQLSDFWPSHFAAISDTMFKIFELHDKVNDIEVFYLSQGLADLLKEKHAEGLLDDYIKILKNLLSGDQGTSSLFVHLDKIGFLDILVSDKNCHLTTWFCRGFAGIIAPSALEKIWDKLIAGSTRILIFMAFSLIESSKMALQACQTSEEAVRCLLTV